MSAWFEEETEVIIYFYEELQGKVWIRPENMKRRNEKGEKRKKWQ